MTDAPDLEPTALPCPFCGSIMHPAVFDFDGEPYVPGFEVRCDASGIDGLHDRGCGATSGWGETADEAIAAWNRRAARSAPEAGKAAVKPLEWRVFCSNSGNCDAETPFGEYVIQNEEGVWILYLLGDDAGSGKYDTLNAAEAAAQADYEQRVLSALASSPAPTGAEPTGEIAGLIARLKRHYPGEEPMPLMTEAAAALTASEAEAADLRRKLEEHQDAEDKAAREMATVIQGLRNRATAAERKLEEARRALEEIRDMPITELISVYEIAKAALSGASE